MSCPFLNVKSGIVFSDQGENPEPVKGMIWLREEMSPTT